MVEFVRDLIKQLEGPFVLALDSPWGTGKTTVVRMLRASLKKDGITSVYFNAWKEDCVSDPLIPMVAAIDELQVADPEADKQFVERMAAVKEVVSKVAKRGLVAAVKLATLNSVDLDDVAADVLASSAGEVTDDVIESFKHEKAALDRFRDALSQAVKAIDPDGESKPLVFFIDELDRCRPTFAIELLERVKHLFDVKHIVFVLSIDKKQLEAITAAVYGERIDAPEYLRRFIDLDFSLPALHTKSFTRSLCERFGFSDEFAKRTRQNQFLNDFDHFVQTFTLIAGAFDLSLRARERCLSRLAVVISQTHESHPLDPIVIAFLLALRIVRQDLFQGLMSGGIPPRDVMDRVTEMPGAGDFASDRISAIVEAYLVLGDVRRERGDEVFRSLQKIASSTDNPERDRAHQVVEMAGYINRWGREFSLRHVSRKLDLASNIGDDW